MRARWPFALRSSARTLALSVAGIALAVAGIALALVARRRFAALSVYAHRGYASVAPENTVAAVEWATSRADGVEVDVRRCGSGELVCVHDADLERLAGTTDRVDETDWTDLQEYTVAGSTSTVARLDDVLEALPTGYPVVVELKARGLAPDVLSAVDRHDLDVQFSSFDPGALAELRARDDDVSLAYTFRHDDVDRALRTASQLDCDAIHPRLDRCLRTRLVSRAHAHGLAVVAWTVDSRVEAWLLGLVGVDGVFADRPVAGGRSGTPRVGHRL